MMGVGLTLAILVDATLIRALLMPAAMRIMGSANWWAPRLPFRTRKALTTSPVRDHDRRPEMTGV